MGRADDKIETFESELLRPALQEVCEARRLLEDYTATVITPESEAGPAARELVEVLEKAAANGRRTGPSLALENRERAADWPKLAGRYVMTPFYDVQGDDVFAAPGVVFWMRFNENLHVFNHRYDNAYADFPIEQVTRPQILNHVLASFDFYKIYAFSDEPFPGFRSPHKA